MINLLSQDHRKQLRAARHNHLLSGYMVAAGVVVALLIVSTVFSYITLSIEQQSYESITEAQEPEKAKYQQDLKLAKSYEEDLRAAKTILQNEIKYSDVLIQIAKVLPSNARLAAFDINAESLQKPIELSIVTESYDEAVETKEAFQSSKYFEGAKLMTIDQADEGYGAVLVTKIHHKAFIALRDEQ